MSTKILMVCLGNICRSPLAEGIFRSLLPKDSFEIHSAGIQNWHQGNPPDHRSIAIAQKRGIDISQQQSRPFLATDFEYFDWIFAMDLKNLHDLKNKTNVIAHREKTVLLGDALAPQLEIPDPYYGTMQDFEEVYQLLYKVAQKRAEQLNP